MLATRDQWNFETIELEEGFETLTETVKVARKVSGKVIDNKNNPITGATIRNTQNEIVSNISDATGDFTIFIDYTQ